MSIALMSSNKDDLWEDKARVAHCLPVVAELMGDTSKGYIRQRVIGSSIMFLGIPRRRLIRYALNYHHHAKSPAQYFDWVGGENGPRCPRINLMALHHVGFVYRARLQDFPWMEKIGFSRDPYARVKSLSAQTGMTHVLEDFVDGCFFDEARSFLVRRRDHFFQEWFLDPERSFGGVPPYFGDNIPIQHWRSAVARSRLATNVRNLAPLEIIKADVKQKRVWA